MGHGLGAMPLFASRQEGVQHIDSVDLDEEVLAAFKAVFPNAPSSVHVHQGDAVDFVLGKGKYAESGPLAQYDIIFDDVFDDYTKITYDYKPVHGRISKGGHFFSNCIDVKKADYCENMYKRLVSVFGMCKKVFRGNKLIYCTKL